MPTYIDELSLQLDELSKEITTAMSRATSLNTEKASLVNEILQLISTVEQVPDDLLKIKQQELARISKKDEYNQQILSEKTEQFMTVKAKLLVETNKLANIVTALQETIEQVTQASDNTHIFASECKKDLTKHPLAARHEELNQTSEIQLQELERNINQLLVKSSFFEPTQYKSHLETPATSLELK